MSRIAKYPVPLPKGVELNLASGQISIKGPLGTIARVADPNVEVKKEGEQIVFNDWNPSPNTVSSVTPDGATTTKLFTAFRVWSLGVSHGAGTIATIRFAS